MRKKKIKHQENPFAFKENGDVLAAFADVQEVYASTYSRSETRQTPQLSFPNLCSSGSPFRYDQVGGIDPSEAVALCITAYWNFALLRQVVETCVDLASSKVVLKGGNKKTKDFLRVWLKKIGINDLSGQFFREWFRSGNWAAYRVDGKISEQDKVKMTQVFGSAAEKNIQIPVKYITIEPRGLRVGGEFIFGNPEYHLLLSGPALAMFQKLANIKGKVKDATGEEIDLLASKEQKFPLDKKHLTVLKYKAQDYEPLGIPMAYGVLKDIEAKLELKRIDLSIARTTDRALLLINVGESPTDHNKGQNINPNTITSLQNLFNTESIARTLVADYTVKANWLIPEINKILGAEKYAQLDKDIAIGLNSVFLNEGEKFANVSIKVQIFLDRLKEARNAFIDKFLQPEIIRVCKSIGAKNYPTVAFEELGFKDEVQYSRIVLQMAQLGLLTPEETFHALETGVLPSPSDSLENQEIFKEQKQKDLYLPLTGGSSELQRRQIIEQAKQAKQQAQMKQSTPQPAGRPSGSGIPKSSNTTSPIKQSRAAHSMSKLKDLLKPVGELHNQIEAGLKKHYKLKKLNEGQTEMASLLVESIISNESQDKWGESVASYIKAPQDTNQEAKNEIESLMIEHNIDSYSAAILRLTKTEAPDGQ